MPQIMTQNPIAASASAPAAPRSQSTVAQKWLLNSVLATALSVGFFSEALTASPSEAAGAPIADSNTKSASLALRARPLGTKRDPVEALVPRNLRGTGVEPSAHDFPGTFVVKFRDEVKARVITSDFSFEGAEITSLSGRDITLAQSLIRYFGGETRQWIRKSQSELANLEVRASTMSGRAQPDLAGMILVSGVATEQLFEAARTLNELDVIEFVSISRHHANLQCDPANPADCNVPSPSCTNPFPGTDAEDRTDCNPDPGGDNPLYGCNNPDCCTQVAAFDPLCSDPDDGNGWDVYCAAYANMLCGGSVYAPAPDTGDFDPCFFDPTAPDDINPIFEPVFSQFQAGSCVTPHNGAGCNQPACCAAVCTIDPTCCSLNDGAWDSSCANLVLSGQVSTCVIPTPTSDDSPDLTVQQTPTGLQGYQYYTQGGPRSAELVDYANLGETWLGALGTGALGFSGHGLALEEMDEFQNLIWQFYQGGVAGTNPYLRGAGVRIGILESSGYTLHEDFILAGPAKNPTRPWDGPLLGQSKIIAEAGQSPLFIEAGNISANHGTNVMGVLLAADNGFGVTGVASGAQGYFYPIVSAENGFRAQDALVSCLSEFEGGDVINFSWGFVGGTTYFPTSTAGIPVNPVTSDIAYSVLLTLGSDLGVTSVVAAGSGARAIEGSTEVDQGAIICTAIYPGNLLEGSAQLPGYRTCEVAFDQENLNLIRYPGSNFQGEDTENADQVPTASGWGYAVATTGASTNYDNTTVPNPESFLFQGLNDQPPTDVAAGLQVDRLRTYTQNFGGTSAATAMITGVVARMQAAAKQFYGTPISAGSIRRIMIDTPSSFGQCLCSLAAWRDAPWGEGPPFEADSCAPPECTGADECIPIGCACERRSVARFPNLQQLPATLLGADLFDGNQANVEVITGGQLIGYSWSSFQIRVEDNNFLRIAPERVTAGTTRQGLTYLATGPSTDVRVKLKAPFSDPQAEINSLGLRLVSRATKNFVLAGAFVYNFGTGRYEFFGSDFLTTISNTLQFQLPDTGSYGQYLDPATGEIVMRVWTCALGATGRHQVAHDLIEIVINNPFIPL